RRGFAMDAATKRPRVDAEQADGADAGEIRDGDFQRWNMEDTVAYLRREGLEHAVDSCAVKFLLEPGSGNRFEGAADAVQTNRRMQSPEPPAKIRAASAFSGTPNLGAEI
ncbi:hypothetical protein DNTS_010892, partial [Danionella cerebrum]